MRKNAVCHPRARVAYPALKFGETCHSNWTSQPKTSAMSAIQLVRATTARLSKRTQRANVVMKYGVGFAAGNFVIAIMIKTNGSEAASAGTLRRACGESGKKRFAAKSDTEKKKTPDPAATMRKLARSMDGPTEIQTNAETNVRTTAAAMASKERRNRATPT